MYSEVLPLHDTIKINFIQCVWKVWDSIWSSKKIGSTGRMKNLEYTLTPAAVC